MADHRPAALASFGPLFAWPIADEADAALEMGRLGDAIEAKLGAAFQARGVVPLRSSDTELRLEYAVPLPGGGARSFCCDLALRVRAVCHGPGRWWIEARPRVFAEVVTRSSVVAQAEGIEDLAMLWREIAGLIEHVGAQPRAAAYGGLSLATAQVVFGAPVALAPGDAADPAAAIARLTDEAARLLAARAPPGAALPFRRAQHALTLLRTQKDDEAPAQRLTIDIELQVAPAADGLVVVPRLFGESAAPRRTGAEDLLFLGHDGEALTALLDETRATLAALQDAAAPSDVPGVTGVTAVPGVPGVLTGSTAPHPPDTEAGTR